jgi:phospholipid/cholesterol/gamma-HCH transport system permease protein
MDQPEQPEEAHPHRLSDAIWHGVTGAFAPATRLIDAIGAHVILVGKAFFWLVRPPYRIGNYLEAAEYIGFGSLPIVLLVGVFTGMVTALQAVTGFRDFGLEAYAGGTTALALATELAPVLASLMLAGRVGAGIAAELGTMRITEQIDALESMAINPVQFLVLPRLVAAIIVSPILMLCFFLVGMGGAYLVAVVNMGVDHGQFIFYVRQFLRPLHVVHGLIKAGVFGFAVVLIGCFQGYFAKGGGRGVGIGTNRAVVAGSVAVLSLDYFLSEILLKVLPAAPK